MRDEREATPAADVSWHRRQWDKINRPQAGCGCLWILLALFMIGVIITMIVSVGYSGYDYL